MGREVFAKEPVFVDSERDHEQVEYAEQDKADVVGEAETIELVGDEEGKDDDAGRICPEPFAQEKEYEDDFYEAVTEEVKGVESLL